MNTQTAIVPGSLSQVAQRNSQSLAETFCNCDVIIIVDVSGSMHAQDSRGGQSRYDVACDELARLQSTMPGKIGVIAFSDMTQFCPGGLPTYMGGGTNLTGALKFAKIADVTGMRFIVISDGEPDDRQGALAAARTYQCKIDVIYVGPEGDMASGRKFLEQLAGVKNGQFVNAKCAMQLAEKINTLLLEGRNV